LIEIDNDYDSLIEIDNDYDHDNDNEHEGSRLPKKRCLMFPFDIQYSLLDIRYSN